MIKMVCENSNFQRTIFDGLTSNMSPDKGQKYLWPNRLMSNRGSTKAQSCIVQNVI